MYIILKLCKVRVTIVFFGMFLLQNDKFISDFIVAEKNWFFFVFQPQIKKVVIFFIPLNGFQILFYTCVLLKNICHYLNDFATVCGSQGCGHNQNRYHTEYSLMGKNETHAQRQGNSTKNSKRSCDIVDQTIGILVLINVTSIFFFRSEYMQQMLPFKLCFKDAY